MNTLQKKIKVPVVSSTHYDREWRFSLQQTRASLVDLMDHLLAILRTQPEFRVYHMDSQSVILEDYLSLRPEKADEIRARMAEGRLLAGPWYSLPDMNLVGGEAIVRNLVMGHRVAGSFGPVMKVGYTPTGFGHIAQLPQIYRGFGIDTALFYRGPDRSRLDKEFIWETLDGSWVVAYIFSPEFGRMPLNHCVTRRVLYGQAFYERVRSWDEGEAPFRLDDQRTRWDLYYQGNYKESFHLEAIAAETRRMIETELKHSSLNTFLCLDGNDSTEPQPLTPRLLEAMNSVCQTHEFVHADLPAFAQVLREAAPRLKRYRGEMRSSARDGVQVNLFGDTLSARTDLKILNADAENRLIGWAEPFATFAWIEGAEYPARLLDGAWRDLLNNQSHDCIAGCGQDIVHEDMVYYFRQVREVADETTRRALFHLATRLDTKGLGNKEALLLVYNPRPVPQTAAVDMRVDLPSAWGAKSLRILDLNGRPVPFEIQRAATGRKVLIHRPKDAPGQYAMDSWWIRIQAADVPPFGWTCYRAEPALEEDRKLHVVPSNDRKIENELLSLEVNRQGLLDLTEKSTGRVFRGLHLFEDRGEVGDAYFSISPQQDRVVRAPGGEYDVQVMRGPVSSSIQLAFSIATPATTEKSSRSSETIAIPIKTTATLNKGSPFIEFRTELDNRARDHKLRVVFPTGIASETSIADMPFDLLQRPTRAPDTKGWFERGYPNHPMRHLCAVANERQGLAILVRGLPEYEVLPDSDNAIALTLLRTTRVMTPKIKAIDPDQKGTQQLGPQVFEYAVLPFNGMEQICRVQACAQNYALAMRAAQVGKQEGHLPPAASFLSVPAPFEISAVKRSEDGKSVLVRLWNTSLENAAATLQTGFDVAQAWLTNLAEERSEQIDVQNQRRVKLSARPRQILTVELTK